MLTDQRRHFDELFATDADPWCYRTRFSERRRHALVLAMLDRPSYRRGFEPGCASGVLTQKLAGRCESLLATDASARAVTHAESAIEHLGNVTLQHRELPGEWPEGQFDLIVLVDFLYYLPPDDVERVIWRAHASLSDHGTLLVGHWRGHADDFLTPTEAVHRTAREVAGSAAPIRLDDPDQLIDVWTRG